MFSQFNIGTNPPNKNLKESDLLLKGTFSPKSELRNLKEVQSSTRHTL
jgi:hypothetical protein